jgi:pimeloyl-ACP methyl ester carboxylesterase
MKRIFFNNFIIISVVFLIGCSQPTYQHLVDANGYQFNVRIAGEFENGQPVNELVVFLHGCPETSFMWVDTMAFLAQHGYSCVAPDQRGYSPGARPLLVSQYELDKLVSDIIALVDTTDVHKFHLVGHDWGAVIGWAINQKHPDRIQTWSAMAVPHNFSFFDKRFNDSDQKKASAYINFLKLPYPIPELFISAFNYNALKAGWTSHSQEEIDEYMNVFNQKNALRGAINWYRALPNDLNDFPSYIQNTVATPTVYFWGNRDQYVLRTAAENCAQYMTGPFEFVELDSSHWIIQDQKTTVNEKILELIQNNPIQ